MTKDGVLVLIAQNHRTQERNRAEALRAARRSDPRSGVPPVPRRATKPTKASRRERLEGKKRRSGVKNLRGKVSFE